MNLLLPPPPAHQRLLGTTFNVGMGTAAVLADFDFETYSEAGYVWDDAKRKWRGPEGAPKGKKGLPIIGAANYAAHHSTRVVCLAYNLKDGLGERAWVPGMPPPQDLFNYLANGGVIEAWNVAFERWIWELVCVPRLGWPAIHPRQYRCAMAKARVAAYPGKLSEAGKVLELSIQKDKEGGRLLEVFCMPNDPSPSDPRTSILPIWSHDELLRRYQQTAETGFKPTLRALQSNYADSTSLLRYNVIDIQSEAEASSRVPDMQPDELRWWQVHEEINHRGVHMDRAAIDNCIAVVQQALLKYNSELHALIGIDAASKVAQIQTWLRSRGVFLDSLDEEAVDEALKGTLEPIVRRVLEIRAAVGSASVKKVFSMNLRMGASNRMFDLFIASGARTGRSTGEGPQPLNSPKAGPDMIECSCGHHHGTHCTTCPWCGTLVPPGKRPVEWSPAVAEDALAVLAHRSLPILEAVMGDPLQVIAGCLRGLYTAAPGHDLICSDYNSIEAVGLAQLSGEQWRIDVFNTHGKIYETSAARMYGLSFDEMMAMRGYDTTQPEWWKQDAKGKHHPLRMKGKIGELAFGYGGWLGSAKAFGMPGEDDEIKKDILAWRRASPSVEWLWGGQTRGKANGVRVNAGIPTDTDRWDPSPEYFGTEGAAVLAIMDPGVEYPVMRLNGTHNGITYIRRGEALYCRLQSGRYLTYHYPRLTPGERGGMDISYWGHNSNPKNGAYGWICMRTWGSRLVENYNQAECADIMRHACINLEAANYPVVLHIYDEIVSEIPKGFGSHEEFERIMETLPTWAAEWPVKAPGSWRGHRYRKG